MIWSAWAFSFVQLAVNSSSRLVKVWSFLLMSFNLWVDLSSLSFSNDAFSKYDVASFNYDLELFTGTNSGMFVSNLLDNVITKNKKDKTHTITVIYGEVNTTNTDEIRQLKTNFEDSKNYEVSLDYGSDGFVNKVTIFDK